MITAILSEVSEYKVIGFKQVWTSLQKSILSSYIVNLRSEVATTKTWTLSNTLIAL